MASEETLTLVEFFRFLRNSILNLTSVGDPRDVPLYNWDWAFELPEKWICEMFDLTGQVDEFGNWRWDGIGNPIDDRGNIISQIHIYADTEKWTSLVRDEELELVMTHCQLLTTHPEHPTDPDHRGEQ